MSPVAPDLEVNVDRRAGELGPTLRLAAPMVVTELGWMAMGVVDLFMVRRLGPEAIGAVGLGNMLFFAVFIFGLGLLLGLDTLVPQAFGAGDVADCHRSLVHGLYLSLAVTPPTVLVLLLVQHGLGSMGVDPTVVPLASAYMGTLHWSVLPLLAFFACRRYLQGMSIGRPVMFALISANLVNLAANEVLIYGRLGLPALGVVGSGWSTVLGRLWMAGVLAVAIVRHDRRAHTGLSHTPLAIEPARMRGLLGLGLPVAVQLTAEVGVFAVAATLAGRLGSSALAAHEIVLNVVGTAFMVPLGVSSAASARVGQAIGRGDPAGAARAGWTALAVGVAFMVGVILLLAGLPRSILALYTDDPVVVRTGVSLLAVACLFQLFDGTQIVASGALRGAGSTRLPMACYILAHWAFGLPVGYLLAFSRGWGLLGLWVGLATGLIVAGLTLLAAWALKVRSLGGERP
ncbi:MAG TPA: MATE family efflux transporter [Isosphaeraceae bacterium]|jgi:MATE family multidrug resistance protein|nr:MATE family efflux transporter [Isosphaeraceae bacterium]